MGVYLRRSILLVFCLFITFGGTVFTYAQTVDPVVLTEDERDYISTKGNIRMVVDPDWYPYEKVDEGGIHRGISADLIGLISERTGIHFELVHTSNWDESLKVARSGKADVVSFLNQTPERSRWLIFTKPYYTDPNVLITREEHDYVSNLARLTGETIVLPEGTSLEERLRKDYPNLKIIIVKSEEEALSYVDRKKADMTLRSLTMAAYVIKSKGYFNLKIAGEVPNYTNYLRVGVTKEDAVLQEILNKGITSITEQEIQNVINHHISINVTKGFDYRLFGIVFSIFSVVLLSSFFWISRIQRLNRHLKQRQEELVLLSEKLTAGETQYRVIAAELEEKNSLLQEVAFVDTLTGLQNRYSFNQRVAEEIERVKRYDSPLSLLLLDLDNFKRINDAYGHDAGDEVIRKVSATLRNMLREVDLVARWGGEEFVVLLPGVGLNNAIDVGEKLRKAAASLIHLEKETVTISIGVSTWTQFDFMNLWFTRTDKALYHAKQQGRNRVCVSDGSETFIQDLLVWDTSWESGHSLIDEQHKELLIICNELISLILKNDLKLSIIPNLEAVLQYIQKHFEYEENVLCQINYEDLSTHIQSHHRLLQKAEELVKKSADGKLLPGDVVRFIVSDVVTMHLVHEDTKFFNIFRNVD